MAGERADVDRVAEAIRGSAEEAVRLLSELIRLPSPPGSEEPVARLMLEWLGASGIDAELVAIDDAVRDDPDYSLGDEPFEYSGRNNVVASLGEGGGRRSLIVSTHLDVVPAAESQSIQPRRLTHGAPQGNTAHEPYGQPKDKERGAHQQHTTEHQRRDRDRPCSARRHHVICEAVQQDIGIQAQSRRNFLQSRKWNLQCESHDGRHKE